MSFSAKIMGSGANVVSESIDYSILQSADSFDFSVKVPQDADLRYQVRYTCPNGTTFCSNNFQLNGFYQSSEPNNTTDSIASAEQLNGGNSLPNIDMELLVGPSVSGRISRILSAGTAEPVALTIRVEDVSGNKLQTGFLNVEIPAGVEFVDYTIVVDPDENARWTVRAFCNTTLTPFGCLDYAENTYFDEDTPTTNSSADISAADELLGDTVHTGKNFTLVPSKAIAGVLMLPESQTAPGEGITLSLVATLYAGNAPTSTIESTTATISSGGTFANYRLPIPDIESADWRLTISCDIQTTPIGCQPLTALTTYYQLGTSASSTVFAENLNLLDGDSDLTSTNITLISAGVAAGSIFLDNGRVAPDGGLVVRFTGDGIFKGARELNLSELVTIPAGANSAPLILSLTRLELSLGESRQNVIQLIHLEYAMALNLRPSTLRMQATTPVPRSLNLRPS